MATETMIFKIDGVDFSDCVKLEGFEWELNDIEAENAGRNTLDALMNRAVVATKRTGTMHGPEALQAARVRQLAAALHKPYVSVTVTDFLSTTYSGKFYCAKISCTADGSRGGVVWVKDLQFTLVER